MIKEFLCQTHWLDKALTLVAILAFFLILNIIYVFGRIKASFDNDDGARNQYLIKLCALRIYDHIQTHLFP